MTEEQIEIVFATAQTTIMLIEVIAEFRKDGSEVGEEWTNSGLFLEVKLIGLDFTKLEHVKMQFERLFSIYSITKYWLYSSCCTIHP